MLWFNNLFNIYLMAGDVGTMTNKKLAKMKNNIAFQNTFARLVQDALHRYYIEGLPETCSERVVLQSLLWYGSVVFFEKEGNIIALPGVPTGQGFNVYGDPAEAFVFSAIGQYNQPVKLYLPGSDESAFLKNTIAGKATGEVKGVYVRENEIVYPFIRHVIWFADAIADSMRTLDVCRQNIKQPYIITAEESIVNSVKEFFKQRDINQDYIISSGVFPADKIALLPFETNADNLDNATELIDWYENKFRELCGVENNGQIDKKGENLITTEVDVNNEYTWAAVDKCMNCIQKGLDDVNKLYGTNMQVQKFEKEVTENDDIRRDDTDDSDTVSE